MKTLILFLFTTSLLSLYGQADNLKGSFLIGGSASFDYSKRKNDDGSKIYIELKYDPTIAYFISNKINVGLSISSYQYFVRPIGASSDYNHIEIYLSGFMRYYPVSKFFFYMDIGIGTVFDEIKIADLKSGNNLILGRIGMGYSWFISDRVIFEPKLHYAYLRYENINIDNMFETENKINFALSFMFVLNRNK